MINGTSGNSGFSVRLSWIGKFTFFCAIQSGLTALRLDHDQLARPSISPRSSASAISAVPG